MSEVRDYREHNPTIGRAIKVRLIMIWRILVTKKVILLTITPTQGSDTVIDIEIMFTRVHAEMVVNTCMIAAESIHDIKQGEKSIDEQLKNIFNEDNSQSLN